MWRCRLRLTGDIRISRSRGITLRHPPQSERDSPAEHCPSAYATCRSPARPCSPFPRQLQLSAGSWNKKRRVVAKVEWHPGELVPRVGFIVTNLSRPTKRVVAFYNHRGTAEPHQGRQERHQGPVCHVASSATMPFGSSFTPSPTMGNFMGPALPKEVEHWSMTLRDKLVKIGAKVVRHGRYVTFQLAEVAVPRDLFRKILSLIDDLRRDPLRRSRGNRRRGESDRRGVSGWRKNDRVAFQARADYQNHAIGWLHRGYSSLGGGKVVISTNLDGIWGMSVNPIYTPRV